MSDWQPIESAPQGKVVLTKIDDGDGVRNEQTLIRQGRLWFFPDKSMTTRDRTDERAVLAEALAGRYEVEGQIGDLAVAFHASLAANPQMIVRHSMTIQTTRRPISLTLTILPQFRLH